LGPRKGKSLKKGSNFKNIVRGRGKKNQSKGKKRVPVIMREKTKRGLENGRDDSRGGLESSRRNTKLGGRGRGSEKRKRCAENKRWVAWEGSALNMRSRKSHSSRRE